MFQQKYKQAVGALALAAAMASGGFVAHADGGDWKRGHGNDQRVKTVFVIAMENHNWTSQPA